MRRRVAAAAVATAFLVTIFGAFWLASVLIARPQASLDFAMKYGGLGVAAILPVNAICLLWRRRRANARPVEGALP